MLERNVERAVLDVFREMDSLGGVLASMEQRYQRNKIQEPAHRYEKQIEAGERRIIGLNRYKSLEPMPKVALARPTQAKQRRQVKRLRAFKKKHARSAPEALARLESGVGIGLGAEGIALDFAAPTLATGQHIARSRSSGGWEPRAAKSRAC